DNEFRFQQLEQGGSAGGSQQKSDAGADGDTSIASGTTTQAPDAGATGTGAPDAGASVAGQSVEDVIIDSGTGDPGTLIPGTGAPPKNFGTITVDKNGNVIDAGGTQSTTADSAPAPNA